MNWRDNLRPGSFRGVRFKATRHRKGQGRRGPHHQYPNRDRGWVEDLGLNDKRLTLDAYVIGNDYMARRDALDAAMHQKGVGELIHPWLGRIMAVPDPDSDQSFTESSDQGGMARFSLAFLNASDTPDFPSASAAASESEAAAVRAAAVATYAARMVLSGTPQIAEAARAEVDAAVIGIEATRPLTGVAQADIDVFDTVHLATQARHAIASADPFAALSALVDLVLAVTSVIRAGKRVLASPEGVDAATRAMLIPRAPVAVETSISARRIAVNALSIANAVRLAALGQASQAIAARAYDSTDDAHAALRLLDAEVEASIRAEADSDGDAALVRALTALRGTTRETLLANAANLVPIARIDPMTSLPGLALTWRVNGSINAEADLLARNRVSHPFWCPAEAVQVKIDV